MPLSPADIAETIRRLRCTPAEAAALALLTGGALLALALLWFVARPDPGLPDAAAQPTGTASSTPGVEVTTAEVVVHVAGAVRRPGVYALAGGSRVAEALDAAGGARRKAVLDGLNLARVLTDGEQVLVPAKGDVAESGGAESAGGSSAGSAAKVSLNQATPTDLETLPNIGPVLAQRIIDHRDSIGGFSDVGQLRDVPGIGEKTFQALVELVTL